MELKTVVNIALHEFLLKVKTIPVSVIVCLNSYDNPYAFVEHNDKC